MGKWLEGFKQFREDGYTKKERTTFEKWIWILTGFGLLFDVVLYVVIILTCIKYIAG